MPMRCFYLSVDAGSCRHHQTSRRRQGTVLPAAAIDYAIVNTISAAGTPVVSCTFVLRHGCVRELYVQGT